MNPSKLTYADVLKSSSSFLNPGLPVRAIEPKRLRERLSEDAKKRLRAAIHDQPMSEIAEPWQQTYHQVLLY